MEGDVSAGRRGRLPVGRPVLWGAGIFLLALALRGAWIGYVNPDPLDGGFWTRGEGDTVFYYGSALGLADGEGYKNPWTVEDTSLYPLGHPLFLAEALTGEDTSLYPPGYPLFLAGAFKLFGQHLLVGKLLNVFLGASTACLVYVLGTKIVNRRVGIVAGGIVALFPTHVFFSTVLMTETLFTTLFTALILLVMLWSIERRPSPWQLLLLGLLVGFMSLVRAEAVLLIPAMAVIWKFVVPSWRKLAQYLAVFIIGAAIIAIPWAARNYVKFNEFELRSGGTTPVRIGLSPNYEERVLLYSFQYEPPSFADIGRHYLAHPWDIGTVAVRKLSSLYHNDTDAFTWIQGNHVPPPLSSEAVSGWSTLAKSYYFTVGSLAALGISAWLVVWEKRRFLLLGILASWTLVYLPIVPEPRYHFPVIPVLSILAAFVLVSGWDTGRRTIVHWLARADLGNRLLPSDTRPTSASSVSGKTFATDQPGRLRSRLAERVFVHPPWLRSGRMALVLLFLFLVALVAGATGRGQVDLDAQARDIVRQADLRRIAGALITHWYQLGSFPSTGGLADLQSLCASPDDAGCALEAILADLPRDPRGYPEVNGYWYASDGTTYIVYALAETKEPWSGPRCPSTPPQLAGRGDLQCLSSGAPDFSDLFDR